MMHIPKKSFGQRLANKAAVHFVDAHRDAFADKGPRMAGKRDLEVAAGGSSGKAWPLWVFALDHDVEAAADQAPRILLGHFVVELHKPAAALVNDARVNLVGKLCRRRARPPAIWKNMNLAKANVANDAAS